MSIKGLLRGAFLALLVVAFQGTWVLAGTTGSIQGLIADENGHPIAGASVTAAAPSQTVKGVTDSKGFYSILNLAPDTYAVTISKDGYDTSTVYGLTVQADQITKGDVTLRPTAKVLGHVTATAQASVVNRTITGDLYAVSGQAINSYNGSAGGSETLYSQAGVVGSLPGVVRNVGGGGNYNGQGALSVRGGAYDQVGYELEGIPLNRGFDFYNSTSFISNGLASIEVYTGGSPADAGRAMSGYVNGTINRGKFPGGSDLTLALAGPSYNHTVSFDAYGATPNERFTWYVSTLAANVGYNWGDRSNLDGHTLNIPANDPGCPAFNFTAGNFGNPTLNCASAQALGVPMSEGVFNNNSVPTNAERDTVANLHWAVMHGGLQDDLQALYVTGTTGGPFPYSGGTLDPAFYNFEIGAGNVGNRLLWPTGAFYTGVVGQGYDPNKLVTLTWPTSGGSTGFIPTTFVDSQSTQYSIEKLGYTRSLTQSSFVRLFAYQLYSFWSLDEPTEGINGGSFYQLHDNATGITLNYQNQLNQQNLITIDADYTKDLTLRTNYFNFTGAPPTCVSADPCATPGDPVTFVSAPQNNWSTVTPITGDIVLQDAFHPTDKLLLDVGVRFDQFKFDLMDMPVTGPNGLAFLSEEQDGRCLFGFNYSPTDPRVIGDGTQNCFDLLNLDTNPLHHPGAANWTNPPKTLTFNEFSPRFGLTYTIDSTNVVRFSAGRYVQPPNSAFEQYRDNPAYGPGITVRRLDRFYDNLGFYTVHNVQPEDSTNYDASYEHDFAHGVSAKVTPFVRNTRGQILNLPVNPAQPSFVTGYNFGNARIRGAEFLVRKNRTSEDGLSATLAATYTDSKIRFSKAPNGLSVIDSVNGVCDNVNSIFTGIAGYNCQHGTNFPLLDPNGYYSPSFVQTGPTGPSYDVKWVVNLNLDERTHGWDVSPTFNYQSGNPYGDPLDFVDPSGLSTIGPNPYTGQFDGFGSLKGPSWWTVNLGISHDVGQNSKAGFLITSLYSSVHNQGYAWEYPASNGVISYGGSDFYALNPLPTTHYSGQNYYPYTPYNIMPLRTYIFTLSTKL